MSLNPKAINSMRNKINISTFQMKNKIPLSGAIFSYFFPYMLIMLQNDELKDLIKKMLDSANLEEVTMKTVLKDVSSSSYL